MKTQVQQFHNKEFGSVEIVLIDGSHIFPPPNARGFSAIPILKRQYVTIAKG